MVGRGGGGRLAPSGTRTLEAIIFFTLAAADSASNPSETAASPTTPRSRKCTGTYAIALVASVTSTPLLRLSATAARRSGSCGRSGYASCTCSAASA